MIGVDDFPPSTVGQLMGRSLRACSRSVAQIHSRCGGGTRRAVRADLGQRAQVDARPLKRPSSTAPIFKEATGLELAMLDGVRVAPDLSRSVRAGTSRAVLRSPRFAPGFTLAEELSP
ncbi:hypothetical protein [Nonomuraea rhodomycinica]|uniref:Uncharacterized protein n=1 Tax=Nonomuraea rhodomycinica TaxID=1712872 RepID=A0A7Y6IXM4_9ACTN|nr:hypothetical protein [Nonomuraea rhodomycinica]NUW46035.1 hypothetical protein [Nonomuraea rhodomycinica]